MRKYIFSLWYLSQRNIIEVDSCVLPAHMISETGYKKEGLIRRKARLAAWISVQKDVVDNEGGFWLNSYIGFYKVLRILSNMERKQTWAAFLE